MVRTNCFCHQLNECFMSSNSLPEIKHVDIIRDLLPLFVWRFIFYLLRTLRCVFNRDMFIKLHVNLISGLFDIPCYVTTAYSNKQFLCIIEEKIYLIEKITQNVQHIFLFNMLLGLIVNSLGRQRRENKCQKQS